MSSFYNNYHKKNKKVQTRVISRSNYTYQTILNLITKHFRIQGNVIDVGCGVGTISLFLASHGHSVVGIDISDDAINLAKRSNKELGFDTKFEAMDVSKLLHKAAFDYAICSEVIEHVVDDKKLVQSIYKLLKKEGVVILSTPLSSAPLYRWGMLKNFDERVGHLRRYTKTSITTLLIDEGFKIIDVRLTEGALRNFLYTHDNFGFILRFAKWPITYLFNFFDNILILLFGASNIYIVAKK